MPWNNLVKWIIRYGDDEHPDIHKFKHFIEKYGLRGVPSPLHFACLVDNSSIVKILIDNGADVNAMDSNNATPLHWACCQGKYSTVKYLLKHGADTSLVDMNGNSVLMYAIEKGLVEIVKLLIEEYNMNVHTNNHNLQNSIDIAYEEEEIEVLKYFIKEEIIDENTYLINYGFINTSLDFVLQSFFKKLNKVDTQSITRQDEIYWEIEGTRK